MPNDTVSETTDVQKDVTAGAVTAPRAGVLEYLPIGLFGSVMGLTGLSVAWQLAHDRFGVSRVFSDAIGDTALVVFVLVAAGYAIKFVTASQAVRAEFAHPIAGNLFGTFFISLLLLPIVLARFDMTLARTVWVIGAVGMTGFGWFMVDRWMNHRQQVVHATPAWIIPVVGMLDIPLALQALGLQSMYGVMVLGLAVGLFFTVPLFTMIFSRLVFEEPLPDPLQPSLLILMAPFAVGTSAYIATTGQIDLFAKSLFVMTLFMLAVLLGRLRYLPRCCPFRVSWWAVSFPLAAAAIAALRIDAAATGPTTDVIAITLLALATIVIAALLARTALGLARGELRRLSS
jgi:tellurite resistance protein